MGDAKRVVKIAIVFVEIAALMRGEAEQPSLVNVEPSGEGVDRVIKGIEELVGIAGPVFVLGLPRSGGAGPRHITIGPFAAFDAVAGGNTRL